MKTKQDEKTKELLEKVVSLKDDRVKRWKATHELLRHTNKKARKEQDKVAKDCESVRKERIFKRTKSKKMGLRFGVAMPPITWNALVSTDMLMFGRSDLFNTDKEDYKDIKGSNQIVKDLEEAFPEYRVS